MGKYDAYGEIELNDKTLSKRVEKTLEQLSSDPTASISKACNDPHQAKGVYRLLSNEKFTAEAVHEISKQETITRIRESGVQVILIPQDTTAIDYYGLKNTTGLGNIGPGENSRGLMMHSAIAVGEDGRIFGLLKEKIWSRPAETKGDRKTLPIEEKESYKWLETLRDAQLPDDLGGVHAIHLCDREGDLYELYARASVEGATYLCRRVQNRKIQSENGNEKYLDLFISNLPVNGILEVEIPRDSHTKREARHAQLEIKFGKAQLKKPANSRKTDTLPDSIGVNVISAKEINPQENVKEPISWQLITNDSVESFDDAVLCVSRYTQRWKIETFHYTLKSGCAIEKLQENTAEKLIKLIALYSVIALGIMTVTFLARTNPDISCEEEFSTEEWKILYKIAKKTKDVPENPPTIYEAVIMIAKLGGFLARKSDGFPGVTVIWRGLIKFFTIVEAVPYIV